MLQGRGEKLLALCWKVFARLFSRSPSLRQITRLSWFVGSCLRLEDFTNKDIQLIQAVRRLYNPKGKRLPLPWVIELNRRLIKGYEKYKDDARIIELKKSILAYNKRLFAVGIRDHQLAYAKRHMVTIFFTFWYRLAKLCLLSVLVIPGTFLFSLVFILGKVISIQKSKEALAASNVKIHARDVMATWKLLVALAVAPISYAFHVSWVTTLYWYNNFFDYLPPGIPLKWLIIAQIIIYPIITYAALRFGEVGMDIAKSLWPLLKMMSPWSSNELVKLQAWREELVDRVNTIINTLGPEMFDDFDSKRIIREPWTQSPPASPGGKQPSLYVSKRGSTQWEGPNTPGSFPHDSPLGGTTPHAHVHYPSDLIESHHQIPRNESFDDLANQDFFSTRPSTPKKGHSRKASSNDGFQLKEFSTLDGDGETSLEEVHRKIRGAMRERGRRRSAADVRRYEEGEEGSASEEEEGEGGYFEGRKDR